MKKILAIATLVGVALTGCVTNDVIDDVTSEIKMSVVNKVANRAIIESTTVPNDFKFDVYGYFSEDSFANTQEFAMHDVECTKNGDYYKNADTSYYWPLTGEVGFYAVAPSTVAPSVDWATGMTLTNYTVAGAEDIDLMFAYNKGSKQSAALNMVFYHALTLTKVQLVTDKEYADVTLAVTGIAFNKIDVTANCVYKELSPANTTAEPSITWSGNTDATATQQYASTSQDVVYNGGTAVEYGSGSLVIPQSMTGAATISINYSLTQNGKTINGSVSKPITTAWVAGNKCIYTLTFKLDEILFNPSANDWVEITADAITIE